MNQKLAFLLVVGATLAASACTSVSTSSVEMKDHNYLDGVVYYLPKGRIHITGGAPKAAAAKTPAKDKDGKLVTVDSAGGTNAGAGGGGTGANGYVITVTADLQPDPSQAFYLKRDGNYLYDDDITLSVNAKGLLSTGNAVSTDETVQIVSEVAELAGRLGIQAFTAGVQEPEPFDVIFDPRNATERANAKETMAEANVNLRRVEMGSVPSLFPKPESQTNLASPAHAGIAVRLALPWTVTVDNMHKDASLKISAVTTVLLPDKGRAFYVDMSRIPFVKKVTKVGFTDGLLTSFSQTVPSPILGVLGLPKAIISALIPIPTPPATTEGTTP